MPLTDGLALATSCTTRPPRTWPLIAVAVFWVFFNVGFYLSMP